MNNGLICRRSVVASTLLLSTACLLAIAPTQAVAQGMTTNLRPSVTATASATKFLVYVGGGANISPPDTFGGGGGIPLISMSNGAAFMAGEITSKGDKAKLIKVSLAVTNLAQVPSSFKIGDVSLIIGSDTLNDFAAVGYDSKLCAMGDEDRKKVKEIVVTVPPKATRRLSYVFPLFNPDAKHGELVVAGSTPVPFEIAGTPHK